MMTAHSLRKMLTAVDRWYRRHARVLPWRVGPEARDAGVKPDPYLVWLSEVMLQQTTIPHAAPYFEAFRARYPGRFRRGLVMYAVPCRAPAPAPSSPPPRCPGPR